MVDYEFYKTFYSMAYPGDAALTQEEWSHFGKRAEEQLMLYKRLYIVTVPADLVVMDKEAHNGTCLPYAESMAVCAMAEALANFAMIQSGAAGPVNSASIGSVSVSYGSSSGNAVDLSPKGQARELYRCARRYLEIYRGVG